VGSAGSVGVEMGFSSSLLEEQPIVKAAMVKAIAVNRVFILFPFKELG
jgi:hypothetical protein